MALIEKKPKECLTGPEYKVEIISSPTISHNLSILRNELTEKDRFRECADRIFYEVESKLIE